ncbi:MAG: hypothetical protein NVS2B12_36750 [Ktedonobacteraceae bacterium]
MLVAQQVFAQDHLLARKHHLGVPTRKFYFGSPRPSTSATFLLFVQFTLALLLGISVIGYGLYLDVLTTIAYHIHWVWGWLLIALALPASFGLLMYVRGNKRLVILNLASCVLGLLLISLWRGVLFSLGSQPGPLASILSGLFLQIVGLMILGTTLYFAPFPRWLLICADGCIFMNKFHCSKIIRWDQITSIHMGKGFASIVCNNGTVLKLYTTWANSGAAQHLIHAKAFRYLLARARATYQSGGPVYFGRFTVSQRGIYNGKQLFPWAQLRSCEYIDAGLALISKDDLCLDLTYLSQLPNATVFVELINSVLEGYSKTEQISF